MSVRDRTPRPKSSAYITRAGANVLRDELNQLWGVERPRVTQEVADAAAQGDRSENAEYQYGKKRLREIDRRVRFLTKRLEEVTIVSEAPSDPSKVFFGAYVEFEDDEGELTKIRIVGPDEFDPSKGLISLDSPMAKALLGKREDDDVVVVRPKGVGNFTITSVSYDE